MADATGPLAAYLADISARLAALESGAGVAPPAASSDSSAVSPKVTAYDEYIANTIVPFVATCDKIGDKCAKLGAAVKSGSDALRAVLVMSSQCKKPAANDMAKVLSGITASMREAGGLRERDDFENHAKAVCEGMSAFAWPSVEPLPCPFIESYVDASVFWANKVRVSKKSAANGADHVEWCKQLNQVWKNLYTYVKTHHTTGLTWNPKGGDASSFSGATAPAPAAVAKTPAPAAAKPPAASLRSNLFAELGKIDQSSGKTAGLKHVTKDMKSKNIKDPPKVKKAVVPKPAVKKAVVATKPPVFAQHGNKWAIENQTEGVITLEEDKVSIKQQVYIYGCQNNTVVINGKVNNITLDNCKKSKLVFNSVLASTEIVNCKSVQVQCKGMTPTVAIDKTDGILVYLSTECLPNVKIVTSKSSEMNISFPGKNAGDDYIEMPIPEQFVHTVTPEGVTSNVSELYQ